jgi:uncharacterized protein
LNQYADTSAIIPLFINEATSKAAANWFGSNRKKPAVSLLVIGEFNAVVSKYVRMGKLDQTGAVDIVSQFDLWRKNTAILVEHQSVDFEVAASLVRIPFPKLLMPDALHIATCQRLGLKLISFDQDLLTIALREGVMASLPA